MLSDDVESSLKLGAKPSVRTLYTIWKQRLPVPMQKKSSKRAVRDNARKHHPSIIPWSKLSENEKQKDRDTVPHALRPGPPMVKQAR